MLGLVQRYGVYRAALVPALGPHRLGHRLEATRKPRAVVSVAQRMSV